MNEQQKPMEQEPPAIQHAAMGAGPLLQRDYWAIVRGSRLTPEEIMELVRSSFSTFAPKEMARFTTASDSTCLDVGTEMNIGLKLAGDCRVRVVNLTPLTFTLRTLEGHPEAGRITFAAEFRGDHQIVFRIRSRARAGSPMHLIGYNLLGQSMQTSVWLTFIQRVAAACNGTLEGVHEQTTEVQENLADQGELDTPTLVVHDDTESRQKEAA